MDAITAAMREVEQGKVFNSPAVNPEMETFEDIATMVIATKLITGKPVSLKFGVGQIKDAYEFLEFLRDSNAMPDHIQIDGAGETFSAGSGAAPIGGDTSLPLRVATIAVDAMLKKLGVRDEVFSDVSGDILLPADGVEMLGLNADGISAARLWMGMGLACAKVSHCKEGMCPYGIASRTNAIFTPGLDPLKTGRKAPKPRPTGPAPTSARSPRPASTTGATSATPRGSQGAPNIRKNDGKRDVRLAAYYPFDYIKGELGAVMTDDEIRRFVYGGNLSLHKGRSSYYFQVECPASWLRDCGTFRQSTGRAWARRRRCAPGRGGPKAGARTRSRSWSLDRARSGLDTPAQARGRSSAASASRGSG